MDQNALLPQNQALSGVAFLFNRACTQTITSSITSHPPLQSRLGTEE